MIIHLTQTLSYTEKRSHLSILLCNFKYRCYILVDSRKEFYPLKLIITITHAAKE
jgi:hypothetical protein